MKHPACGGGSSAERACEVTRQGLATEITRARRNMGGRKQARSRFTAFGRTGPRWTDHATQCALAWPGGPGTIRRERALGFQLMAAGRQS